MGDQFSPTFPPLNMQSLTLLILAAVVATALAEPLFYGKKNKGYCHYSYDTHYETVFDVAYKQECSTTYEKSCHTAYEKKCSTSYVTEYEKTCDYHGYEPKCTNNPVKRPTSSCHDVPRQSCEQVPRSYCHKVPHKVARQIPVEVPKQICESYGKPHYPYGHGHGYGGYKKGGLFGGLFHKKNKGYGYPYRHGYASGYGYH